MLIYDPSQDPTHYVFRLLQILKQRPTNQIEFDKYRIIDFYLMFPSALASMRLPDTTDLKSLKQIVKSEENRYNVVRSPHLHFAKVEKLQLSAVRHLLSIGILDRDAFGHRMLQRTAVQLGEELNRMLSDTIENADPLRRIILEKIMEIGLFGSNGLKARSKLMEYKYDAE